MTDWYLLLAPIAVLGVLCLLRFVGCNQIFGLDPTTEIPPKDANPSEEYPKAVTNDTPVAYLRLQETQGATVAKNAIGPPDGTYTTLTEQVNAGDPNWHSTGLFVNQLVLDLGVTHPPLLQGGDVSIRVRGGYVDVPANAAPLNNLTEFTVEAMVFPQGDIDFDQTKYYCLLELAEYLPNSGQKNAGFGLYAGPQDPNNPGDPNFPFAWQFWMGTGPGGYARVTEVRPYVPDDDPNDPNLGPTVQPEVTYLAVTYSQSQAKAFLYLYHDSRNVSHTTYELNVVPYVPAATAHLLIGMVDQGPLFPPSASPPLRMYPFEGQISNVAIYDKALTIDQVLAHGFAAFNSDVVTP
jgi:hypothetical protein